MRRRIFCLTATLVIAADQWALRSEWFTEPALWPIGRNPLICEQVDIRHAGTVTWSVDRDGWAFHNGLAQLSLVLNMQTMLEIPKDRAGNHNGLIRNAIRADVLENARDCSERLF
jgi:hypothetical protein